MDRVFDTGLYRDKQVAAFHAAMPHGRPVMIEFGGKPFGDYHASRVLPGYDPDVKAGIVGDVYHELCRRSLGGASITMAVHAKDILMQPDGRRPQARIRGDYGIPYDEEVLRMTDEARGTHHIPIGNVAITSMPVKPTEESIDTIGKFTDKLNREFDVVRILPEISGYPYIEQNSVVKELTQAEPITRPTESEIILSPGGGSGKFSVVITELAHKLEAGENPHYIKFETFPVFHLPVDHPLNRAFIAATVDLANDLVQLSNGQTNYDKDIGNFHLLQTLLARYPNLGTDMHNFKSPTDMGVNVIETGIIDPDGVERACREEIARRMERYTTEVKNGLESRDVLGRMKGIALG